MPRIESLLSARLFMAPQVVGERIYFISNLSGRLSLYAMDFGGSVPEPLLPPHIALQNPHLIGGETFCVFSKLSQILVMIDHDGDENYQPMLLPLSGGFPEPAFKGFFAPYRVHLVRCDLVHNFVYFNAESTTSQNQESYQGNLATGELTHMGSSIYGAFPAMVNEAHDRAILVDGYSVGDNVLFDWKKGEEERKLLFGTPLDERQEGYDEPLDGITTGYFTAGDKGLLLVSAIFEDTYSLGYFPLPEDKKKGKRLVRKDIQPVAVRNLRHTGMGELVNLIHLKGNRYLLDYNIDGCDWVYEGTFDEDNLVMVLEHVLVGEGMLKDGVLESIHYDKEWDRFALSYSTATFPTQIFTIEGEKRSIVLMHTCERVLGIPQEWLSAGEDASYTTFDGQRVSARLYLPAKALGFQGPRPLVYYVHGGPQGQERPDFAWFSMPLIQHLTLNGFAVFVPNVRGSTGYGLAYTKEVDRDWGGKDRLDHVHAMTSVLPKDARLDVKRAVVVGRSYGGYMTLTLASRHPELWAAAADMFGPYNLLTFLERIPITWKPYYLIALGDVEKDRDFLLERSPSTYMSQITCPMLVIQGKQDPRVVEKESHDLVDQLRKEGKKVEYLMFENEGHDVLKFENRVACYNAITEFFRKTLKP